MSLTFAPRWNRSQQTQKNSLLPQDHRLHRNPGLLRLSGGLQSCPTSEACSDHPVQPTLEPCSDNEGRLLSRPSFNQTASRLGATVAAELAPHDFGLADGSKKLNEHAVAKKSAPALSLTMPCACDCCLGRPSASGSRSAQLAHSSSRFESAFRAALHTFAQGPTESLPESLALMPSRVSLRP